MLVYEVILNLVLLLQFVVNGQQEICTEGHFRQQPRQKGNGIFIQYCFGRSWYYLCGEGVGWTPTLATVACRQLGHSDQGANFSFSTTCDDLPRRNLTTFRTNQPCNGTETSLVECGGVHRVNGICVCGQVADIMCQPAVTVTQSLATAATSGSDINTTTLMDDASTPVTTFIITTTVDNVSTTTTSTTTTIDSVSPTITSQDDNTTSINNTALGAVIGVLVALVAVVLISVVCIVVVYMCKKSHQPEVPSTKENECYSLRQLDDPVYDEAAQPNYISQDLDEEATEDQVTNGYDSIKCVTSTKPRREVTHPTPKNESIENDFHDTDQHTNEVVNSNKKSQMKSDARNQQQTNAQETPANPTPVRNEASKIGNDFYDAEEHTYSVVNNKKKANKKPPEYEGERKDDLQ